MIAHGEDPEDDNALLMWAPFISDFKRAIQNWHVEGIDSTVYVRSASRKVLVL